MDDTMQKYSAMVEENAAAAKTLKHQAHSMDERVSVLRLRGEADSAESSRPAATHEHPRVAASPGTMGRRNRSEPLISYRAGQTVQ